MCRRCGAPLQSGPETSRVTMPSTMHRRGANAGGVTGSATGGVNVAARPRPAVSPLGAVAAAARNGPADTLLPGAFPRPDDLLARPVRGTANATAEAPGTMVGRPRGRKGSSPRARAARYARAHWRRIIVLVAVGIALTLSLTQVWPVLFSSNANSTSFPAASAARESVATDLLRTVSGGGRALYSPGKVYPEVTPAVLSSFSYRVPVVGPRTVAAPGTVSMRLNSPRMMTLATPADAERCVFARDEPAKGPTKFVTVRTTDCRAASAPTKGWATR